MSLRAVIVIAIAVLGSACASSHDAEVLPGILASRPMNSLSIEDWSAVCHWQEDRAGGPVAMCVDGDEFYQGYEQCLGDFDGPNWAETCDTTIGEYFDCNERRYDYCETGEGYVETQAACEPIACFPPTAD